MSPLQKVVFFNMGTSKCLQIESKIEYLSSKRGVLIHKLPFLYSILKPDVRFETASTFCVVDSRYYFLSELVAVLSELSVYTSELVSELVSELYEHPSCTGIVTKNADDHQSFQKLHVAIKFNS